MVNFLEDLKKAADTGEFNSEAAKKIIEINELATSKTGDGSPEHFEKLKEKVEKLYEGSVKPVTEEKALELNSKYEEEMKKIKQVDAVNTQLATLIEIEDMVKATIGDMLGYIEEIETRLSEEIGKENSIYSELHQKMEKIKSTYKSSINN